MPLVFSQRPECLSAGQVKPAESLVSEVPANLPEGAVNLIDPRFDQDSCGVGFVASALAKRSHRILEDALTALSRLEHRGAVAADGASSDGVGLMTNVPRALLLKAAGIELAEDATLGVGMVFTPQEETRAEAIIESARDPSACAASPDWLDMRGNKVRPNAVGMAALLWTSPIGTA